MDKSSDGIKAGSRAIEAVERWKAGIAFLALLVAIGGASFLVAALPMMIAAALFNAPYLTAGTNIGCVAAVAVFPWMLTNESMSRALRSILGLRR